MKVCSVALHHEVLTAWAAYRKSSSRPPEVLTLDFHTDVLCSARRGIPVPRPGAWQDEKSVVQAVSLLHHDEHFDWALHSGMIARAVIISLSPCSVPPEHPALEVRYSEELPDVMTLLNEPESSRPFAAAVLTDGFLQKQLAGNFPEPGFILDIDCDYFLCREALHPAQHTIFDRLLGSAGLITLSRENDWVKILQLPGEKLSGEEISGILEEYIHAFTAPER